MTNHKVFSLKIFTGALQNLLKHTKKQLQIIDFETQIHDFRTKLMTYLGMPVVYIRIDFWSYTVESKQLLN